jgi:hypothetical protein
MKHSPNEITPIRRTALHEAGHAAMRYLYGRSNPDLMSSFKSITIEPDEDSLGKVEGHSEQWMEDPDGFIELDYTVIGSWDERTRRRVEHLIMVMLAGTVTEEIYEVRDTDETTPITTSGGESVDVYVGGSRHDLDGVTHLMSLVGGGQETQEAFVEWLSCRTRDFLSDPFNRAAVEALATELENRGTLGYPKAVEVMHLGMDSALQARAAHFRDR